jgi:hypothetical protein
LQQISPTPSNFATIFILKQFPFATMAAPAAPERVDIDRDGDLTLVVGPERRKFLVCSRTLSRASPVFKQMLYGNPQWQESRPKDPSQLPWVVKLPGDNHDATKTLLEIIHSRFAHVPSICATVDELYEILVVAGKYDMTKLLRPWVQGWVTSLPPLQDNQAIWPALGVATELGAEEIVRQLFWRIIEETKCDQEGNILVQLASGKMLALETAGVALTPFKLIGKSERRIEPTAGSPVTDEA